MRFIENQKNSKIKFKFVQTGQGFMFGSAFYLKLQPFNRADGLLVNAVNVNTGYCYSFDPEYEITKVVNCIKEHDPEAIVCSQ